jgi:hypothetical protein
MKNIIIIPIICCLTTVIIGLASCSPLPPAYEYQITLDNDSTVTIYNGTKETVVHMDTIANYFAIDNQ